MLEVEPAARLGFLVYVLTGDAEFRASRGTRADFESLTEDTAGLFSYVAWTEIVADEYFPPFDETP